MRKLWMTVGIVAALVGAARAQVPGVDDDASCRLTAGAPGSAAYRQCMIFMVQARAGDPYTAAAARAGLADLQRRLFAQERDEEESPDFAAYGRPLGAAPPAPSRGCVLLGDGLGGGIADCQ